MEGFEKQRQGHGHGQVQSSGMLSRGQLLTLFHDFSNLITRPEVKKRIAEAVKAKKEAVAVTTELQGELFYKMGIEPKFGITCLGKVNAIYKDDRELMLQFYNFVTKEELACDEAELGPEAFHQKMQQFQSVQEKQLKMLRQMRESPIKDQQLFLQKLHDHMQKTHDEQGSSMDFQEVHDFFQKQLGGLRKFHV